MLSCELINDFSRLEELSSDWESLWRADSCGEIFQSFGWARAWWHAYGKDFTVCALSVSDGNRVIGIVPLVRRDDMIVFLGQKQSDYCDILCQDERAVEVLTISLQRLFEVPGWKRCFFQNLKPEGRLLSHWAKLPIKLRSRLLVHSAEDCKTILLHGDRTILASLINKDHTRRRLNKLRKAGLLTFRHIETKSEAEMQLAQFFQHHVRRHVLAGKRSSTEKPEFRKFLRALIDELDLTDSLRFGVLELNGHPLAWHFSFEVNGKFAFYQQTFDVEAWDYAPGEVLVHQLLLYAQNHIEREFDFTRGDEPFKIRFATHRRKSYSMYVDRPDLQGRARQFARANTFPLIRLKQSTISLAKHYPKVFQTYRTTRLWFNGFLARLKNDEQKLSLIRGLRNTALEFLRFTRLDKAEIEVFAAEVDNAADFGELNQSLMAREAQFGDLVDLADQHPEILTAFELLDYRQRLKNGDRLYMLWRGEQFVLGAWAGTREPSELLNLLPGHSILRDRRYLLVYHWWKSDTDWDCCRDLLGLLSDTAKAKRLALAVCCPVPFPHLREELVQQGFELRHRLVRPRAWRQFQVKGAPSTGCSDATKARELLSSDEA